MLCENLGIKRAGHRTPLDLLFSLCDRGEFPRWPRRTICRPCGLRQLESILSDRLSRAIGEPSNWT